MSEFADNLVLLLGAMGYKIFKELTKHSIPNNAKYFIKATRGANATAIVTSEGVVVLKDSIAANTEVQSMSAALANKRKTLIESGIIVYWKFSRNYLFSSPSTAAAVVMGRNANGLLEWKHLDGTTLKDNQVQ
jgi:hypothetical protein